MTSSANTDVEDDAHFLPYGPPTDQDERPPLVRKERGTISVEQYADEGYESIVEELMDGLDGCPTNLHNLDVDECETIREWSLTVRELFKQNATFQDLRKHLYRWEICSILLHGCATPQNSLQSGTSGDLLPIPPWNITVDIPGVSERNEMWIKAILCVINFHYCVGWSKPICAPFKDGLSELQITAVSEMAKVVTSNIISGTPLKSLGESEKLLNSKKFDYSGNPIEYMEDLICERVLPAWPRPGQAGI